ncbi:MAG: TM2 domain-containing protein [Caldilineaceae bacterium]|nr:TM2 domain-containing protein [Caldilineaceae bacterium]
MKGQILDYSVQRNEGVISADDGTRYTFAGAEWQATVPPITGMSVDFAPSGSSATQIYRIGGSVNTIRTKSRVTAGIFAILLGGLGIHKFYLGYNGPGIILLVISLIGWPLAFVPNFIVGVIVLIEGIIYLTKSGDEFEETYVVGRRAWF